MSDLSRNRFNELLVVPLEEGITEISRPNYEQMSRSRNQEFLPSANQQINSELVKTQERERSKEIASNQQLNHVNELLNGDRGNLRTLHAVPEIMITEASTVNKDEDNGLSLDEINNSFANLNDEYNRIINNKTTTGEDQELNNLLEQVKTDCESFVSLLDESTSESIKSSPGGRTMSPDPRTMAPDPRTLSPSSRMISPSSRTIYDEYMPGARTISPGTRTTSPGARAISPGVNALPSGARAISPGPNALSSGVRAISPGVRAIAVPKRRKTFNSFEYPKTPQSAPVVGRALTAPPLRYLPLLRNPPPPQNPAPLQSRGDRFQQIANYSLDRTSYNSIALQSPARPIPTPQNVKTLNKSKNEISKLMAELFIELEKSSFNDERYNFYLDQLNQAKQQVNVILQKQASEEFQTNRQEIKNILISVDNAIRKLINAQFATNQSGEIKNRIATTAKVADNLKEIVNIVDDLVHNNTIGGHTESKKEIINNMVVETNKQTSAVNKNGKMMLQTVEEKTKRPVTADDLLVQAKPKQTSFKTSSMPLIQSTPKRQIIPMPQQSGKTKLPKTMCICKQILPSLSELAELEMFESDELDRSLRRWHIARRDIINKMGTAIRKPIK